MLMKYTTLWLFTLPLPPCNLYVLFTSHFRLIYTLALAGDIAFFFYRVHNIVFNARIYACMHVRMYAKYTFVCNTTPRYMPHFVGDGETN